MFQFLFNCIKTFGLGAGIVIYFRIKVFGATHVSIPGIRDAVHFRQNRVDLGTFREIFFRKEYDVTLPAGFHPQIIIDAGANIGFTSLFLNRRFPDAKIFSMEPNAENFSLLKRNTASCPNIIPIQSALFDRDGIINLEDKGFGVRGYMVTVSDEPLGEKLPAMTMATLIKEHKIERIDILKMDIEGSEKEVFEQGASGWLPITACLIVELHDRMKPGCSKAVFQALSHYNFSCGIRGENLVFINNDILRGQTVS